MPQPPDTMTKTFQEYKNFIKPLKEDKFNLTEKELKLTQAASINFDYFYEETGFTKHQIAGLISSLDEKGVLYIEYSPPDGSEGPDLYYVSEDFINFIARANIANGTGRYVFAR